MQGFVDPMSRTDEVLTTEFLMEKSIDPPPVITSSLNGSFRIAHLISVEINYYTQPQLLFQCFQLKMELNWMEDSTYKFLEGTLLAV